MRLLPALGGRSKKEKIRDGKVLQANLKTAQGTAVRIPDQAGSLSVWAACAQVTTWLSDRTILVEIFCS